MNKKQAKSGEEEKEMEERGRWESERGMEKQTVLTHLLEREILFWNWERGTDS